MSGGKPAPLRAVLSFVRAVARGIVAYFRWVRTADRAVATLLALAVLVSTLSWFLLDGTQPARLWFPARDARAFMVEVRQIPVRGEAESRLELVASEYLLGPALPNLDPPFSRGVRLRSILLRGDGLYVDLTEEAALLPEAQLRLGLIGLEASLRAAKPGLRHVTLSIGGQELDGLRVGLVEDREKVGLMN